MIFINMTRLTNLIKEVLSTQPKKKDCNCGCNTCENVGNEGVLLNESVAPKQILSENLQYHVHNKLPLTENTFRYGSESFINLWAEARSLYLREIIHVNDDDKEILTETDLGNYGMYEGKKIPLDLPMLEEDLDWGIEKIDWKRIIDREYKEAQRVFGQAVDTKPSKEDYAAAEEYVKTKHGDKWHVQAIGINKAQNKLYIQAQENLQRHLHTGEDDLLDKEYVINRSVNESEDLDWEDDWEDDDNIYTGPYSYGIDKRTWDVDWRLPKDNLFNASKTIKATNNRVDAIRKMLEKFPKELAKFENDPDYPAFDMNYDELVKWYKSISNFSLQEAKKKKKKDPPIGKPKRGGSKAYYVYVRDPRTKKVKKVSFGSGGLKAKINNPKARKAFAARHKCSTKTDKTKAGYWSCRLPRYAKLLGLKSSFSGFW